MRTSHFATFAAKTTQRLAAALLLATTACRLPVPPVALDEDLVEAEVDSCHDGDTCRIHLGGKLTFNVRLAGIDAPEVKGRSGSGQPLGETASIHLNDMVRGQRVTLRAVALDPFNRPVVEMRLGEKVVNTELLQAGLAEVYRASPPALDLAPYDAAEGRARSAGRGIWALTHYTSPADFRRARRPPTPRGEPPSQLPRPRRGS